MRRLRVALCVVLTVAFAGCGDKPQPVSGPSSLKYAPAGASAVLVIPTDLDGEQLRRLEKLLAPMLGDKSLRDAAEALFEDVSFARDVEPLLGKDLVVAEWGDEQNPKVLAAIETSDGKAAEPKAAEATETRRSSPKWCATPRGSRTRRSSPRIPAPGSPRGRAA